MSDSLPENTLAIFKEHDTRMADHAGKDKVFFHVLCTGQYSSYGPEAINKARTGCSHLASVSGTN